MPRSLIVSLVAASTLAFLGLVSFVAWVLDPTIPRAGLHGPGLGLLAAAVLAWGTKRRDERIRAGVVLVALAGMMLMSGTVRDFVVRLATQGWAVAARAAVGVGPVLLLAVMAAALSARSAREWFNPPAAS